MKFGGTSVRTAEQRQRAAERALQAKAAGYDPVVVVSAMGRRGEPYATDTLVSLIEEIGPNCAPREKDLMMACGEIMSAVIMAHLITTVGPDRAIALSGGQAGLTTDRSFGNARILAIDPTRVLRAVENGLIPVVAGFQGIARSPDPHEHGAITTLGRGGSDTTASALGAALHAEEVRIFSDVPGIMTADPTICPVARTLRAVSYAEICEMAHAGAKVLHPRSAEIAMDYHIPLRVLATMGDDEQGTIIVRTPIRSRAREHGVTAVANSGVVVPLELTVAEAREKPDVEREVLTRIADIGVSVYYVTVSDRSLAFVVDKACVDPVREVLEGAHIPVQRPDGSIAEYVVVPPGAEPAGEKALQLAVGGDAVIVSVIGHGLRHVSGVMARLAEALENNGIEIMQVAGSSHALSCLVSAAHRDQAVLRLHEKFHLDKIDEEAVAA
jgi:aspartate kinase